MDPEVNDTNIDKEDDRLDIMTGVGFTIQSFKVG